MTARLVPSSDLIVRKSLLGVRFIDASTGDQVVDGLAIELHARFGHRLIRTPVRGPSGTYSFHSIPGLRALEDLDLGLAAPSGTFEYALYADDRTRRFLPATVLLYLPRTSAQLDVPLFPSPAYTRPSGWAVVRARLGNAKDVSASEEPDVERHPARWARLDVAIGGVTVAKAVSDSRGEIAAHFPYPGTVSATGWRPVVTAFYEPDSQSVLRPPRVRPFRMRLEPADPPELSSITNQAAADVVAKWPVGGARETAASTDFQLVTTAEARVRTTDRPDLWLMPTP